MRFLTVLLLYLLFQPAWAEPSVTLVRVVKSEQKLLLMAGDKSLQEFHVALGANPVGHKQQEGDKRTPEGSYVLDYKKADSAFYKAIHISYPNAGDIASARERGVKPGGQIMIHGQKNGLGWLAPVTQRVNWTDGCIALADPDMDTVWTLVAAGTPIEILP